jgi:hypothetical protein
LDGGVRDKSLSWRPSLTKPRPAFQAAILFIAMSEKKKNEGYTKAVYHRVQKPDNYTAVSNQIAKNPDLSMGAKGLLLTIFSNSDDWFINRRSLLNSTNKDGRTRIKSYMREIESLGFARFSIGKDGKKFVNTWEFFNTPLPLEERSNKTNWNKPRGAINPVVVQETCSTIERTNYINNNITNISTIEESDIVSCYKDERDYELRRTLFGGALL